MRENLSYINQKARNVKFCHLRKCTTLCENLSYINLKARNVNFCHLRKCTNLNRENVDLRNVFEAETLGFSPQKY
jgi:hypothetical protein